MEWGTGEGKKREMRKSSASIRKRNMYPHILIPGIDIHPRPYPSHLHLPPPPNPPAFHLLPLIISNPHRMSHPHQCLTSTS